MAKNYINTSFRQVFIDARRKSFRKLSQDKHLTIYMIGSSGIGKSTFRTCVYDEYKTDPNLSTIDLTIDGHDYKIQLLDHPEDLKPLYTISSHHACIFAFAATSATSFNVMTILHKTILSKRVLDRPLIYVVVALQRDLANDFEVGEPELRDFASKFDRPYFFCSGRNGQGVKNAFEKVIFDHFDYFSPEEWKFLQDQSDPQKSEKKPSKCNVM